jgi:serine protease inhibitor
VSYINSPPCQRLEQSKSRFPKSLQQYNPAAQRAAFDYFSLITHSNTALNEHTILFEGYSVQRVQAITLNTTAFPHREANLPIAPVSIHKSGDQRLEAEAVKFGEKLREIIFQGSNQKENIIC